MFGLMCSDERNQVMQSVSKPMPETSLEIIPDCYSVSNFPGSAIISEHVDKNSRRDVRIYRNDLSMLWLTCPHVAEVSARYFVERKPFALQDDHARFPDTQAEKTLENTSSASVEPKNQMWGHECFTKIGFNKRRKHAIPRNLGRGIWSPRSANLDPITTSARKLWSASRIAGSRRMCPIPSTRITYSHKLIGSLYQPERSPRQMHGQRSTLAPACSATAAVESMNSRLSAARCMGSTCFTEPNDMADAVLRSARGDDQQRESSGAGDLTAVMRWRKISSQMP